MRSLFVGTCATIRVSWRRCAPLTVLVRSDLVGLLPLRTSSLFRCAMGRLDLDVARVVIDSEGVSADRAMSASVTGLGFFSLYIYDLISLGLIWRLI